MSGLPICLVRFCYFVFYTDNPANNNSHTYPTKLEALVITVVMFVRKILHHFTEIVLMIDQLVQFVLVHNGQHEILSRLNRLIQIGARDLRKVQETFFVDPLR